MGESELPPPPPQIAFTTPEQIMARAVKLEAKREADNARPEQPVMLSEAAGSTAASAASPESKQNNRQTEREQIANLLKQGVLRRDGKLAEQSSEAPTIDAQPQAPQFSERFGQQSGRDAGKQTGFARLVRFAGGLFKRKQSETPQPYTEKSHHYNNLEEDDFARDER